MDWGGARLPEYGPFRSLLPVCQPAQLWHSFGPGAGCALSQQGPLARVPLCQHPPPLPPIRLQNVSVVFLDVVGFTSMTAGESAHARGQ